LNNQLKGIMSRGKIIIISGPSGSGKTTLYKKLLENPRLKRKLAKSLSATTRPQRAGERNGRDYLFLTKRQFCHRINIGYFLEWQRVFDNYYGTPKESVERLLRKGRNVLLCIDVKGALVVSRVHPDAIKIFITVPSLAILKERLKARGSEIQKDMTLRLKRARKEIDQAKKYDYIVVNESLQKASCDLESIISSALNQKID